MNETYFLMEDMTEEEYRKAIYESILQYLKEDSKLAEMVRKFIVNQNTEKKTLTKNKRK